MNKEDKEIVLNGIHNHSKEIERLLPYLRDACKRGLRGGKLSISDAIASNCRELADELDKYMDDEFTLDDMQDYRG
jgi:hypothetical protein